MDKLIRKITRKHQTNCPFQLSESFNIRILHQDLGKITRGFFHRRLRRNYIVLHSNLNHCQQRFTCAHELGHFFYDRGSSYFMIDQNTLLLPGRYERRANQFASKLLTQNSFILPGESIFEFCMRHGIPEEMSDLVQPVQAYYEF